MHCIMTEITMPQPSTSEDRLLRLAQTRPVLRARDVSAQGIHTGALTRMARAGALEKVGPGRYRLATSAVTEGHSLVLACSLVPSSVACLSTALLFHNLGTQLPREVWLAVPRGTRIPSFAYPPNDRTDDAELRVQREMAVSPRGTVPASGPPLRMDALGIPDLGE